MKPQYSELQMQSHVGGNDFNPRESRQRDRKIWRHGYLVWGICIRAGSRQILCKGEVCCTGSTWVPKGIRQMLPLGGEVAGGLAEESGKEGSQQPIISRSDTACNAY